VDVGSLFKKNDSYNLLLKYGSKHFFLFNSGSNKNSIDFIFNKNKKYVTAWVNRQQGQITDNFLYTPKNSKFIHKFKIFDDNVLRLYYSHNSLDLKINKWFDIAKYASLKNIF
jgi:hypothetical protein